ncbi:MKRN2 opposite strand protein isoform 2-T4 [Glossophaga mutica]
MVCALGSVSREYDGRSDLHVGITNTNGVVYNYTMHGVQRDEAGWEQSVSIPLLQPGMFGLMDQWDKYLEDFSTTGAWLPHRYQEDRHNCYSYTLTFINCILTTEGKEQLDKNEFTEKFVVPRTRKASKYITLYRAIEEHGFYVIDLPDQEPGPPPGS